MEGSIFRSGRCCKGDQDRLEKQIGVHKGKLLVAPIILCPKDALQRFCKEVVMWKFLQHPNVLPLIGVSMSKTQFAMVSRWMANGTVDEYVKAHSRVDRLRLVGPPVLGLSPLLTAGGHLARRCR